MAEEAFAGGASDGLRERRWAMAPSPALARGEVKHALFGRRTQRLPRSNLTRT